MINKPSLLDTPNLINGKEYTPSDIPGQEVDECYAKDSLIRGDYGVDYAPDWDEGKLLQETLPAAEWDAWMHDLSAYGWQMTEVVRSIWEELYCLINGAQAGMDKQAITQLLSGAQTFTNKTISFYSNTLTGVASVDTAQTLTNKTISFDSNTLQNVASLTTAQTLTNKTISMFDNTVTCPATIISSATATISPSKMMNLVFSGYNGSVLTIDAMPYQGYELPIFCQGEYAYVKFKNPSQEWVCIALTAGQKITLVGCFIGAAAYSVKSGASFGLSANIYNNAPAGFLVNSYKTYLGPGEFSYTYTYSDSTIASTYDVPNINCTVNVTRQLSNGSATCLRWGTMQMWTKRLGNGTWSTWSEIAYASDAQTLTNKTIAFADNTLTGVASTSTAQTLTNKTINFADNTLTGVASTETSQTLKNKTISSTDNSFQFKPIVITDDVTINPAALNKNISIYAASAGQNKTVTLGNAPWNNYRLPIACWTNKLNVVFNRYGSVSTTLYLYQGQCIVLTNDSSGEWIPESGSTFIMGEAAGVSGVCDWRTYWCPGGTYHYSYDCNDGDTVYGLPTNHVNVDVTWFWSNKAAATCTSFTSGQVWVSYWNGTVWSPWFAQATTGTTQTLSNKTLSNATISSTTNNITFAPTSIKTTQTVSPAKETSYLINPDSGSVVLTIDQMPYHGIRIPITCMANAQQYVVFKNWQGNWVCLCMHSGDTIELCGLSTSSDNWSLQNATLSIRNNDEITAAPYNPDDSNIQLIPNDWRVMFGPSGTNHFDYSGTNMASTYGTPTNFGLVDVTFSNINRGMALFKEVAGGSENDGKQNLCYKDFVTTWDSTWAVMTSTTKAQTLTNKTIDNRYNKFLSTPYYMRDTQTFTVPGACSIVIDSGSTAYSTYIISDPPSGSLGFPLTIMASVTKNIQFKSFANGQTTVTKTITPGVHHLYAWTTGGWGYIELSGTYTDNTTFTYLL